MTKNKKLVPIGLNDFKDFIEQNNYFVDKSMFIHSILTSGSQVSLITRPHRFGKTLNMSMLSYFLDCDQPSPEKLFENLASVHPELVA